jgi:hypothetical protein
MARGRGNVGEKADGLAGGSGCNVENARLLECIVAADAEDQVRSVFGQAAHLRGDVLRYGAVNREQAGFPSLRQDIANLQDDIRPACRIRTVVKNGISKQDQVRHDQVESRLRRSRPRYPTTLSSNVNRMPKAGAEEDKEFFSGSRGMKP